MPLDFTTLPGKEDFLVRSCLLRTSIIAVKRSSMTATILPSKAINHVSVRKSLGPGPMPGFWPIGCLKTQIHVTLLTLQKTTEKMTICGHIIPVVLVSVDLSWCRVQPECGWCGVWPDSSSCCSCYFYSVDDARRQVSEQQRWCPSIDSHIAQKRTIVWITTTYNHLQWFWLIRLFS